MKFDICGRPGAEINQNFNMNIFNVLNQPITNTYVNLFVSHYQIPSIFINRL